MGCRTCSDGAPQSLVHEHHSLCFSWSLLFAVLVPLPELLQDVGISIPSLVKVANLLHKFRGITLWAHQASFQQEPGAAYAFIGVRRARKLYEIVEVMYTGL